MAGNRTKSFFGLALAASLAGLLWWFQRSSSPPTPVISGPVPTNSPLPRPKLEPRIPPPPFGATTNLMHYELLADQQVWGSLSLLPGFWGYETRVEVPEVSPRDVLRWQLAEEFGGLLAPLTVVRWTSDWSEFLHRWLDPRLTQPGGLRFFNPSPIYEGMKLPGSKESDFGVGLKYGWSF